MRSGHGPRLAPGVLKQENLMLVGLGPGNLVAEDAGQFEKRGSVPPLGLGVGEQPLAE